MAVDKLISTVEPKSVKFAIGKEPYYQFPAQG